MFKKTNTSTHQPVVYDKQGTAIPRVDTRQASKLPGDDAIKQNKGA